MESWGELQVSILISKYLILFDVFLDKAGIQFQILNRSKGAAVWVSQQARCRTTFTYDLFL